MKVQALHNNYKNTPIKSQSFNGLWGRFSQVTDIEPAMNIPLVKKYFYYFPFKNETEAQIKEAIKNNSEGKIVHEPEDKYIIKEGRRTVGLNITEEEYKKYMELTSSDRIDEETKQLHNLMKNYYSTSGFDDKPQVTAANLNLKI